MATFPKPPVITVTLGATRPEENQTNEEQRKACDGSSEGTSQAPGDRAQPQAFVAGHQSVTQEEEASDLAHLEK